MKAKDRIPDAEYRLVDGVTVIAISKATLIDGAIDNPIEKDENGAQVEILGLGETEVWTGTNQFGERTFAECDAWTVSNAGNGRVGEATLQSSAWTNLGANRGCNRPHRLYCFEQ